MRVDSYTVVHYGKDYLSYALRSVYECVTQAHVIWTPHPSHGHSTNIPPPETREEIHQAAFAHDPDHKVRWYETHNTYYEGPQRDLAVKTCVDAGAEIILVVDCDEVWHTDVLKRAISFVETSNSARNWLVNLVHFWRSFDWCCRDEGWPVRLIDLRHSENVGYVPKQLGEVYHFGYAVRNSIMQYKWQIHGHKNDLRPGWLDNQWQAWPPRPDCHPTNDKGFWNPQIFDKARLPEFMRTHPFYNLERIE